jgi:cysteinyl-tRNA synthetase
LVNCVIAGTEKADAANIDGLKELFQLFVIDILGLKNESPENQSSEKAGALVDLLLNLRIDAKQNKDWATADKIRNQLTTMGVVIRDTKEGFEWEWGA